MLSLALEVPFSFSMRSWKSYCILAIVCAIMLMDCSICITSRSSIFNIDVASASPAPSFCIAVFLVALPVDCCCFACAPCCCAALIDSDKSVNVGCAADFGFVGVLGRLILRLALNDCCLLLLLFWSATLACLHDFCQRCYNNILFIIKKIV